MNMKRLAVAVLLLAASLTVLAQGSSLRVEAPSVVGLDEQFSVTFIIEGDDKPSDFKWSAGDDFNLVWGPQSGSSTSISIVNGKRTRSSQYTYTYILSPKEKGRFTLAPAEAMVKGKSLASSSVNVEVVDNGASSKSSGSASGNSGNGRPSSAAATGDIPAEDLFMKLTLNKTKVVVGEPVTATLKLYQRVNIAGFEDAKFPSFNGFWSQETAAPTNIQFSRESLGDRIYESAVLRSYVLIPQQVGELRIDPAELVCLVNIRSPRRTGSIFDDFFDDGYRTVRKRISSSAVTVDVKPLPAGAPASFGGAVGNFKLGVRISKDSLETHEAASLTVTVQGRGNVSLIDAPKVAFHPDMDVYDVKATDRTDKSSGGTSGIKTFEYPFIPRGHGDFTIEPVEFTYYDVNAGKYVTLSTEPIRYHVARGSSSEAPASGGGTLVVPERKGVRNLAEDIRFISVKKPDLGGQPSFFIGKAGFTVSVIVLVMLALAVYAVFRSLASRRADVAGNRNRKATKMALGRLKKALEYKNQNLHSAFYEELHRSLLGFAADKLALDPEGLSRDNIAARLEASEVEKELIDKYISLLDACEFARYAPDSGADAMNVHYSQAVEVISSLDQNMKSHKSGKKVLMLAIALLSVPFAADAQMSYPDSLWQSGVTHYSDGRWNEAVKDFSGLVSLGCSDVALFYNLGNACFKAEDYPHAILYYERALKIDPSFADARFNLEFARSQIQDKIETVPEFFLKSWMRSLCYKMPSNVWAAVSLVMFALFLGLMLLYLLGSTAAMRRTGFFAGIAALLLSIAAGGFARWQYNDYRNADSAVVTAAVTSVKSSPSSASGKDLFVLHGGTKVKILDDVGQWKNISIADGRQGWISSADIEVI